jgi:hypothetical protein
MKITVLKEVLLCHLAYKYEYLRFENEGGKPPAATIYGA